jgi:hypothetical protein
MLLYFAVAFGLLSILLLIGPADWHQIYAEAQKLAEGSLLASFPCKGQLWLDSNLWKHFHTWPPYLRNIEAISESSCWVGSPDQLGDIVMR